MKKIFFTLMCILFYYSSFSQSDTLRFKKINGILFFSSYNYMYDYKNEEVKSVGFFDFFYPIESIDIKSFLDSNKYMFFKNGVRVEFFKQRNKFKELSVHYNCIDTSSCYFFKDFYFLPVVIDFKLYEDYEPSLCRKNYFDLQVIKGAKFRFENFHKAITISQIEKIRIKQK